jgi:hypothetical protein
MAAVGLGGVAWMSRDRDIAETGATEPARVISLQREEQSEPKTVLVVDQHGRRLEFRRPSKSVVIMRRFDAAGELETTTVYRVGKGEKALSGLVLDARGELLFRCIYGYSVTDGKLVEEQVHRADRAAAQAPGEKAEVAYRVLFSTSDDGLIDSQIMAVDSPEDDPDELPSRGGPGLDGDGRPKGIPSAPFEIPWDKL